MPRISVVMSVYNGLPYLSDAVRSVLDQTYADFEFIIIDDASTDRTWEALGGFAVEDPRIVLLQNTRNQGYTWSLNRGLGIASGEFIARQDADDISRPERFARQVAYLDYHPETGLLGTLPDFIDGSGLSLRPSQRVLKTDNASLQADLLDGNGIWHGSVLIRRHLLQAVGPYDPELEPAEDYDLWLRLAEVTGIANLSDRLYCYRVHDASESYNRRAVQIRNKALALQRAIRRRYQDRPPPDVARFLSRDFLRAAVAAHAGSFPPEVVSECIARALEVDAGIASDAALIERVLRPHVRRSSVAAALDLVEHILDDLLGAPVSLRPLKRQLQFEIHMQEVGRRVATGASSPLKHLWPALRLRPRAVIDWGTWSLMARTLVAGGTTTAAEAPLADTSGRRTGAQGPDDVENRSPLRP